MSKQQVWGNHLSTPPSELNVLFCAGRDVKSLPMCDELLVKYDVWTNTAHAKMLNKVGIINDDELQSLKSALKEILDLSQQGEFTLDPNKEDIHINIEHFITNEKEVVAGKKIHTGRSRNDQVTTDLRLFMRDQLVILSEYTSELINSILELSEREKEGILPGFTHYQPAMISSPAHWFTSWTQGLLRDLKAIQDLFSQVNLSPLGAAASFGTSWPIDREFSASLLGFDGVDENTLDCITSRGENEARIASVTSVLMNRLSNIAQDLIVLSHPYTNFIEIDDAFVTGSSIMPQKRNPDFAEVIKAKTAFSHGIVSSLLSIQKAAFSGYNRDSQQTKSLIMDLFLECREAPLLLSKVFQTVRLNHEAIAEKSELGFMNSADTADWLAQNYELSFRDAYNIVASAVGLSQKEGKLTEESLEKAIQSVQPDLRIDRNDFQQVLNYKKLIDLKTHVGAPSTEAVEGMIQSQRKKLNSHKSFIASKKSQFQKAFENCFA